MSIKNQTFDIIALTSSIVCAIHCAAVPVILSFSALSSIHFLHNSWIEWSFISLGLILVVVSLWPSYRKIHKCTTPLWFAVIGFLFIGISRLEFSVWWETGNTVFGACMVSYAHYRNWRLLKQKQHNH